MRLQIDHYHHFSREAEARLRRIEYYTELILRNQENIMATVQENLDAAEKAARDNSDAEDAIIGILGVLRGEVAALKAAGTDPATASRIEGLAAALTARTPKLAAAAMEGTTPAA